MATGSQRAPLTVEGAALWPSGPSNPPTAEISHYGCKGLKLIVTGTKETNFYYEQSIRLV